MLPVLCPPIEDELLYSQQLAIIYGFEDYAHFVQQFGWTLPKEAVSAGNEKQISQREFFFQFYENPDAPNLESEIFLDITRYDGLALFLFEAQQTRYVKILVTDSRNCF